MNFFEVIFKGDSKKVDIKLPNDKSVSYPTKELNNIKEEYLDNKEHSLILGIRGEHISITDKGLESEITFVELLGNTTNIMTKLVGDEKEFAISLADRSLLNRGDKIHISFLGKNIHLFNKEDGKTIFNYVKEEN